MMLKRIFIISVSSCFSFLFASGEKGAISLDTVSKLIPGSVNKEGLRELFGKPNETTDFRKLANSKSKQEEWTYTQGDRNRLTFIFQEGSDSLHSWVWRVRKGEPENTLSTAKKRFPDAEWQAQTENWINPHAFPMECFYKDEKRGVSLTYNLVRKEVSDISRFKPTRKIASDANEKPPEFCLGTKCTPAIPAAEFFKDQSVAKYCEEIH